jgi:hypothetical protein
MIRDLRGITSPPFRDPSKPALSPRHAWSVVYVVAERDADEHAEHRGCATAIQAPFPIVDDTILLPTARHCGFACEEPWASGGGR